LGGSRAVRRPGGAVQFADQGHRPAAQFDNPVHRRAVLGLQRFHREELRLGEQCRQRVVEGVAQIERDFAGGGELSFGVP